MGKCLELELFNPLFLIVAVKDSQLNYPDATLSW